MPDRTVALGHKIFLDPRLSADGKTSCSTCHIPGSAFSDANPVAIGHHGLAGTRNTPSLTATLASGRTTFFWDGRRDKLEDAVMDPFSNPVEMGLHDRTAVASKVTSLNDYSGWIASNEPAEQVDRKISAALASYLRGLPLAPTRFERFTRGDDTAIDEREKLGMQLFAGKGQCGACHKLSDARLTDDLFHRSGVSMDDIANALPSLTQGVLERNLSGTSLGDRVATHTNEAQLGHFMVSHKVADLETFATPSLREVRLTAPYMHDGSVRTLDDAVDREVYYRGLDTGYPIGLTAQERGDLKAFLGTL
ncbi:cytochrome-c peroxidase [Luteibacter sp. 9135]|uniref:cytochrome-c peroxidase n=1 Tax=Luteibacter sp. 9135 TaxID=1500893 RepID=UPI0009DEE7BD|nr:cytochrome c peroxidase [Luteibacter sp. 9135]